MCMCVLSRLQDDLRTTYVYVRTGPTSRQPMCMDYWVDLKMTYAYGLLGRPQANQGVRTYCVWTGANLITRTYCVQLGVDLCTPMH